MRKMLTLILCLSVASVCYANSTKEREISILPEGKLVLEKKFDADSLAHMDRLIIQNEKTSNEIFNSEGRDIENVFVLYLDNDNIPEIFVQMNLGGSGGYREFALLKKNSKGYRCIWEATGFSGAKTSVNVAKEEGYSLIRIEFMDDNFEPPKPAIAVFGWDKNGFKRLR
ncbi:MAG: hypothetical protein Kow0029_17060 [Candidatus Rifleibacteriota bacterium]